MKNLRLVLVFYITLLSSFQLSNSLFQPQFSFPSHDSANPIKTLIGNLSHVLGLASRERNIRKCKMVLLMFLSQKGIFTLCIPRKILLPFPVFFLLFSSCFAHRKQSKWILQGHLTFPEFHGVFSAFKVSVTGLAVLVV